MNTEIKNLLNGELEKHLRTFLDTHDLHPLLQPFRDQVSIDISAAATAMQAELAQNIVEWWTNKAQDVDTETPLTCISLEYNYLGEPDAEALAYGIGTLGTPLDLNMSTQKLDLFDFVDGFEAMPGVTLSICNPLSHLDDMWQEDEAYENLDLARLDGYWSLVGIYRTSAYLALHEAFGQLDARGALDAINYEAPLHFVIGEHDSGVTIVYVKV